LYDLSRVANKKQRKVPASASRIYDVRIMQNSFSFTVKRPITTLNSARVLLPSEPGKITVTNSGRQAVIDVKSSWDESSNTLYLGFENSTDGIKVNVEW
jgi:hypothetical protein